MKTAKKGEHDLNKILKREHEGKWVAVSADYKKVIGYSSDLDELTNKIRNKEVVYLKGLSSDVIYAFWF